MKKWGSKFKNDMKLQITIRKSIRIKLKNIN